mgnify:CR=1 FL=1
MPCANVASDAICGAFVMNANAADAGEAHGGIDIARLDKPAVVRPIAEWAGLGEGAGEEGEDQEGAGGGEGAAEAPVLARRRSYPALILGARRPLLV